MKNSLKEFRRGYENSVYKNLIVVRESLKISLQESNSSFIKGWVCMKLTFVHMRGVMVWYMYAIWWLFNPYVGATF